ncbi:MAG: hypothetical protein MUO82_02585 [Candidatus Thermoplasmatota archaeon]|nr:hypothetical protein [Candidatus Thermoplasmatota archaeon]
MKKERLLVLGKACPIISKKYEHLVCIAGITDGGEWRRIYPVPWEVFWRGQDTRFKKKTWIEYELESVDPSDHRPESRKVISQSIRQMDESSFAEIKNILDQKLTSLEYLDNKKQTEISLGVIKPIITGFVADDNTHYLELLENQKQQTLFGDSVILIDLPKKEFRYRFNCSGSNDCSGHEMLCIDWELGELYRNCENYRKLGKYPDEKTVLEKVKQRMLDDMNKKPELYFIVGTHNRWGTYMVISIIYPKKANGF